MTAAPTIERDQLERFAYLWLQGSTCHRKPRSIHWASEDNRFVVMKHHGHTEYVDRVNGSLRCETYYALYDITQHQPDALGKPYIWKVKGRWLKTHWDELNRLVAEAASTNCSETDQG